MRDLLASAPGHDVDVLRAVVHISNAVLGAHRFEDALEVIAEQTLVALDAASFSISRWEAQRGVLRTLINVGQLGPGEERWPKGEEYALADYRYIRDLLRHGRPYIHAVDDDDLDPMVETTLNELEKESELAVPVMYGSQMWGELWATGTAGRRFGPDDLGLLQAIGAQVSVAIGRAELFSKVARYAYEDPLTRLANRRGLDERLSEIGEGDGRPTLLVCDLDGLKAVNDRDGHAAGDELLCAVARVLSSVASSHSSPTVARLGGDEFCVLLPSGTVSDAEAFAHTATSKLVADFGPAVSLCWGVASRDAQMCSGHELIAAADGALLEAKRLGRGSLRLHVPGNPGPWFDPDIPRAREFPGRRGTDDLIERVVAALDAEKPTTTLAALELLSYALSQAAAADGWCISATTDDMTGIQVVRGLSSTVAPGSDLKMAITPDTSVFPLADYPTTATAIAQGRAFVAGIGLAGSDPVEVDYLRSRGFAAVLGIGVLDRQRGYLIEIYSYGDHADLVAVAPHAQVLARYCIRDDPGDSWRLSGAHRR